MNEQTQLIPQILRFFVYAVLQGVFFRGVAVYDTAFCMVYIAFLLYFPLDVGRINLMLLGLTMGLAIDIFYDSVGIHSAACVFIAFVRPTVLNLFRPSSGYEGNVPLTLAGMGFKWFVTYTLSMTLIHQLLVFFIEASSVYLILTALSKALAGTVLTFVCLLLADVLFFRKK